MQLSELQIKQMTSFISLNLQDIRDYIDQNRDNYEKWLKDEENNEIKADTGRIFTRFVIGTLDISSLKIRKIYETDNYDYVIVNCY